MQFAYAEVGAPAEAVAVVILDPSGKTWSPSAKGFVMDYPADSRIPLVRPAKHPEAAQVNVPGITIPTVTAYLADSAGKLLYPVPYTLLSPSGSYTAVLAPDASP